MLTRTSFRLALLAALLILYVTGLAGIGIYGPDEPRYAAIGEQMARSGDWVTPRLWGSPWFEKPPLLYWMTATARLCGLGPETGPRLPVALTAVATVLWMFWFLRPRLGCGIATHASILLATCLGWAAFGYVSVVDVPLSAAMTVCLLLIVFDAAPAWVPGAFLGLAVLAKGLVPLVLFAPLLWWLWKQRRLRQLLPIAMAAALVAGPWYAAMGVRYGMPFLADFIVKHHFFRFFSDSLQHVRPFWFYLPVLPGVLLPWSLLAPLVLIRPTPPSDPRLRFLGAWALFGLVFFSLSRNKLPGYILPLVPVLCILIAAALERMEGWRPILLGMTAALLVAVEWGLLPVLPEFLSEGLGKGLATRFDWWLPVIVILAGMICYRIARQGRLTVALTLIASLMAAGLIWVKTSSMAGQIDRTVTARPLSQTAPRDSCVHPGDRNLRYGLSYYWGFEVPECNHATIQKRVQLSGPETAKGVRK